VRRVQRRRIVETNDDRRFGGHLDVVAAREDLRARADSGAFTLRSARSALRSANDERLTPRR